MSDEKILQVEDLRTYFKTDDGTVKAVDGVSFSLGKKESIGIVGESGSGKSVTNLSILRLIPSPPGKIISGKVLLDGTDILQLPKAKLRTIRGNKISMIFQDPMTSLNPFLRISTQMVETIMLHQKLNKQDALSFESSRYLEKDEKIIWSGKPVKSPFMIAGLSVSAFGLLWLSFSIFAMWLMTSPPSGATVEN